jgi:predicted O-methyltransferase YrrM
MQDKRNIEVTDFGTGKDRTRGVSDITMHSLKSAKYGQLLFRTVNYFKSKNVLELGTSLGITTSYLASSAKDIQCVSLEGCPHTAEIAQENFRKLGLENIRVEVGGIDDTLPRVLNKLEKLDLVFLDANHRSSSVLNYFNQCLSKITENSVMIIDDIYWSADMEAAWKEIKNHSKVMATIDLFQIGIIFFNPDLHKKHYKMHY